MRKRKSKISSRDLRYLLVAMVTVTIVASGFAYVALNPPSERFYAVYVLGSSGLVGNYYPNDDPNIVRGEPINWTIGIYNHMGSLQYVVVRVKLLNLTLPSPDDRTGTPSIVKPLFEFARVLVDNETWSIPFAWRITNITSVSGELLVTGMSINQIALTGDLASAASGMNYRFVFELWSYDKAANDLVFSWIDQSGQRSVWTQVWFNATNPVSP